MIVVCVWLILIGFFLSIILNAKYPFILAVNLSPLIAFLFCLVKFGVNDEDKIIKETPKEYWEELSGENIIILDAVEDMGVKQYGTK